MIECATEIHAQFAIKLVGSTRNLPFDLKQEIVRPG